MGCTALKGTVIKCEQQNRKKETTNHQIFRRGILQEQNDTQKKNRLKFHSLNTLADSTTRVNLP